MTWEIREGDCIVVMREMDEASVDAIVTDPPYGLGFMGREWDASPPGDKFAAEALRVLKPGGHLLAFGGTRTYHRLACAIEDAGFEIRDSLGWQHMEHIFCQCGNPRRTNASNGDVRGVPPRPQSAEQHPDEPGTLAYEWLPSGGGAWPGCRGCGKPLEPPFYGGPLAHYYGSGFPKSLDVSKAIDKAAGAEREVVGVKSYPREGTTPVTRKATTIYENGGEADNVGQESNLVTAPATPEATEWQGWGTALKPAHEPIVLARKPLTGTVAGNVTRFGTGALNVDGCRVGTEGGTAGATKGDAPGTSLAGSVDGSLNGKAGEPVPGMGRWPSNVILDPEAAALLDEQSGERPAGVAVRHRSGGNTFGGENEKPAMDDMGYGDTGGASRFFYCAKASRAERNAGLEGFEEKAEGIGDPRPSGQSMVRLDGREPRTAQNVHPTVKPIALMRWLCRLVTPPEVPEYVCPRCDNGDDAKSGRDRLPALRGQDRNLERCPACNSPLERRTRPGRVLDPFAGSGTTGAAAVSEGFDFIGCEREEEYVAIAEARIAFWAKYEGAEVEAVLRSDDHELRDQGQLNLLGELAHWPKRGTLEWIASSSWPKGAA